MFLNQRGMDKEYGSEKVLWGNKAPNKYLVDIINLLPSKGKVLDLGSGEGRNALYLAKKDFDVTAIDISENALAKLKKSAERSGVLVNTKLRDISGLDFGKDWDAIISIATLHLLQSKAQKEVIACMKSATKKAGINLITVFTKDDIGYEEYPHLSFVDLEELKKHYHDWNIMTAENYTKNENHGKPHTHHMAVLVAQKPY